jgi:hypothetical protein
MRIRSPDELDYLTEDDLPSEIPSSDVALRELEEFLRQNQQDPGPNSGSDDPSDLPDVHRVPRSASE